MNIYVGNISFQMNEDDLRNTFTPYGEVTAARIITDKFTGQSKGFGFVEMPDNSEATAAITKLDGIAIQGRNLRVNEAKPQTERTPRTGGDRPRTGRPQGDRPYGGNRGNNSNNNRY